MKQLVLLPTLVTSLGASAAGLPFGISQKKGSTDAERKDLTIVSKADGEITTLKVVNINSASIESSELDAEGGCLIYSFNIQNPSQKSIAEVTVDSGYRQSAWCQTYQRDGAIRKKSARRRREALALKKSCADRSELYLRSSRTASCVP